jgi:hypothetical protein
MAFGVSLYAFRKTRGNPIQFRQRLILDGYRTKQRKSFFNCWRKPLGEYGGLYHPVSPRDDYQNIDFSVWTWL